MRAQGLLDEQFQQDWHAKLGGLCARGNPAAAKLLRYGDGPLRYYWSAEKTEYATDLMFRQAGELGGLYGQRVRASVLGMGCQQVLKFLGKNKKYQEELSTDMRRRSEDLRVKFWAGRNSIKMYDNGGRMVRVETTINDASDLGVALDPGKLLRRDRKERGGRGECRHG